MGLSRNHPAHSDDLTAIFNHNLKGYTRCAPISTKILLSRLTTKHDVISLIIIEKLLDRIAYRILYSNRGSNGNSAIAIKSPSEPNFERPPIHLLRIYHTKNEGFFVQKPFEIEQMVLP